MNWPPIKWIFQMSNCIFTFKLLHCSTGTIACTVVFFCKLWFSQTRKLHEDVNIAMIFCNGIVHPVLCSGLTCDMCCLWWELVAGGVSLTNWGRSWQCQAHRSAADHLTCVSCPCLLSSPPRSPPTSHLPPCKQSITLSCNWTLDGFCLLLHLTFNCSRS